MKYETIDRKKGGAGKQFTQFVKVGYNRARQVNTNGNERKPKMFISKNMKLMD